MSRSATARAARMLEATRPVPFGDRILDRRTSSEIIRDMERNVASPEYAAERDAFYAGRDARAAIERQQQEARWAAETLPAASDACPLASRNHAPAFEAGRGVTGGVS